MCLHDFLPGTYDAINTGFSESRINLASWHGWIHIPYNQIPAKGKCSYHILSKQSLYFGLHDVSQHSQPIERCPLETRQRSQKSPSADQHGQVHLYCEPREGLNCAKSRVCRLYEKNSTGSLTKSSWALPKRLRSVSTFLHPNQTKAWLTTICLSTIVRVERLIF